ncbi:MAG: PD40 domain-containing protein [Caldilineaceae bacterium]|nr:PD40 domain-containing protein [Caldilineaceae bacterium]
MTAPRFTPMILAMILAFVFSGARSTASLANLTAETCGEVQWLMRTTGEQSQVFIPDNSTEVWFTGGLRSNFGSDIRWCLGDIVTEPAGPFDTILGYTIIGRIVAFSYITYIGPVPPLEASLATGDKIAFVSDRDGNNEIYVMNADGSNQTNLTNDPTDDYDPAWSPDGTKLAFSSKRGGNLEIYVVNRDGSNSIKLTDDELSDDFEPAWSPDGTKIAFHRWRYMEETDEIYVMDADGSNQTVLANNADGAPTWSPDGAKIAFASDRDGYAEIYAMNADGSNQVQLTDNASFIFGNDTPAWSPDGIKIAFRHYNGYDGTNYDFEIYVMNADGSNQTNLTNNPSGNDTPAWSPDGTKIAFVSDRDGDDEIYVMNSDGSNQVQLTNNAWGDSSPAWMHDTVPPQGATVTDRITDGHNHPLINVFVGFLSAATNALVDETVTDANGNYTFTGVDRNATYKIQVSLRDAYGRSSVRWGPNEWEVFARTQSFSVESSQTKVVNVDFGDTKLEAGPIPVELLDDLAVIYRHTMEVNSFVREKLALPSFVPVASIWAFQPDDTPLNPFDDGASYAPSDQAITIRGEKASKLLPVTHGRPMNREWHENFHHLMNMAIGYPPGAGINNHGGFSNPTSSDSWAEGWAEFWSCVLWDSLGYPDPHLYRWKQAVPSFEDNWEVWDKLIFNIKSDIGQSMEEYAVASLLWDMYDPKESQDNDNIDLSLKALWNVIGHTTPENDLSDMRDVYLAFRQASLINEDGSPVEVADIDQIFISHGFYADTDNHRWESGEEVGWAGKDARRNTPEIPSAYLKINVVNQDHNPVQSSVLQVEMRYENSYYDYSYIVDLVDGPGEMVFFAPPPTRTLVAANLTVIHNGNESAPVTITNSTYWNKVANSNTGYAEELTFVLEPPNLYLPSLQRSPATLVPSPSIVGIAAGTFHTCALTERGSVNCWGQNSAGQLGDGTNSQRLSPAKVVGLTSTLTG